jgi:prepilin-type N-terminal cleavage/methylation domain-containing protein
MIAIMTRRSVAPIPSDTSARSRTHRGFSLVELLVSMGILSVLLIGVTSAILIASKALPSPNSSAASQALVASALEQLNADLLVATAIKEITTKAITVTVADRGHGAAGPETIRWAWSGTAGAPLTREYNSSGAKTIVPSVSEFALSPEVVARMSKSAPRVLMVVNSTFMLSSEDNARTAKLTEWRFPYTLISALDSQANFNSALAACDVVYVTAGTNPVALWTYLTNPAVGVVTENESLYPTLGISTGYQTQSDSWINLDNNTHPITLGLALGWINILSREESLHRHNDSLAPGLVTLASGMGNLAVLDLHAIRTDGAPARARRVVLPWGGALLDPFALGSLMRDGRTILKRSLAWAAARPVYKSVSVSLTASAAPAVGIRIEMLANPRVPVP